MKILIAGSIQANGGYEEELLCNLLKKELTDMGHIVETFFLPYGRNVLTLPEQILSYRLLEIYDCDLLLTVGYPACMLQYPNKICYLFQTEPMLFEYWETEYGVLANQQFARIRALSIEAERTALANAKKVFCCSEILCQDLRERLSLDNVEKLLYPSLHSEISCGSDNANDRPYWLWESQLLPWQRPKDLLEWFDTMQQQDKEMHLHIFVPAADPIYRQYIDQLIRDKNIESQVKVFDGCATAREYKEAMGIVCSDYKSRRVSNSAVTALEMGKTLIISKDSGALYQYSGAQIIGNEPISWHTMQFSNQNVICSPDVFAKKVVCM